MAGSGVGGGGFSIHRIHHPLMPPLSSRLRPRFLGQQLLVVQELADVRLRIDQLVQRGNLAGQFTLSVVLLLQIRAGQIVDQLQRKKSKTNTP